MIRLRSALTSLRRRSAPGPDRYGGGRIRTGLRQVLPVDPCHLQHGPIALKLHAGVDGVGTYPSQITEQLPENALPGRWQGYRCSKTLSTIQSSSYPPSLSLTFVNKSSSVTSVWSSASTIGVLPPFQVFFFPQGYTHRFLTPNRYTTNRIHPLTLYSRRIMIPANSTGVVLAQTTPPLLAYRRKIKYTQLLTSRPTVRKQLF